MHNRKTKTTEGGLELANEPTAKGTRAHLFQQDVAACVFEGFGGGDEDVTNGPHKSGDNHAHVEHKAAVYDGAALHHVHAEPYLIA